MVLSTEEFVFRCSLQNYTRQLAAASNESERKRFGGIVGGRTRQSISRGLDAAARLDIHPLRSMRQVERIRSYPD